MEDDYSAPKSVRDRIALLQQQASNSNSSPSSSPLSPSLTSSSTTSTRSTSPRIPQSQLSNLYNQSSSPLSTSPAKGSSTAAHSKINARPESPTTSRSRAPSPAKSNRGDKSLQDTLVDQLAGGGGSSRSRTGSVKLSASPNSTTPRSQSPAPPPPLPRRISSPSANDSVSAQTQLRHRSQTVDPSFSSSSSLTQHSSSRGPPQLPPRRSSTLDPSASQTSSPATIHKPSSSATIASSGSNPNKSTSSSSILSTSFQQGPPLPRRKPTLPSGSPNISPRTPVTSSFEPPPPTRQVPRSRPLTSSKPTLNDPLSSISSASIRSNGSTTSRNNSVSSSSPATSKFKIRPIDPRARKRYEQLFYQCLSSPSHDSDSNERAGGGERIEGELVRMIWERSRLPREVLRAVWNEISPKSGSLDKEGFVRGMWLIDEELRRRQKRD
ncbi:hypothetical protein JCM3765_001655 [Sporobolomyces pararoseus]